MLKETFENELANLLNGVALAAVHSVHPDQLQKESFLSNWSAETTTGYNLVTKKIQEISSQGYEQKAIAQAIVLNVLAAKTILGVTGLSGYHIALVSERLMATSCWTNNLLDPVGISSSLIPWMEKVVLDILEEVTPSLWIERAMFLTDGVPVRQVSAPDWFVRAVRKK